MLQNVKVLAQRRQHQGYRKVTSSFLKKTAELKMQAEHWNIYNAF